MNRYFIRQEVRHLIRDDNYPKDSINRAINRVLSQINIGHRYRFHEASEDITLVTDDFDYAVTSTILAEDLVVFDPPVSPKPATLPEPVILVKYASLTDAINAGLFLESGDNPTAYTRHADNWLFDPIPNSTANNKTIRVYHRKDLTQLASDVATPDSRFNARYHVSILAVGAAAEIAPLVQISSTLGAKTIAQTFKENFQNMAAQELWEPLTSHSLLRDDRFRDAEEWGYVGDIGRG